MRLTILFQTSQRTAFYLDGNLFQAQFEINKENSRIFLMGFLRGFFPIDFNVNFKRALKKGSYRARELRIGAFEM